MKKAIEVPKGKNTIGISVSGHSYVELLDANGIETFLFQSPGEHITAVVRPGSHTIERNRKLGKIDFGSTERLQGPAEFDAMTPPGYRTAGMCKVIDLPMLPVATGEWTSERCWRCCLSPGFHYGDIVAGLKEPSRAKQWLSFADNCHPQNTS